MITSKILPGKTRNLLINLVILLIGFTLSAYLVFSYIKELNELPKSNMLRVLTHEVTVYVNEQIESMLQGLENDPLNDMCLNEGIGMILSDQKGRVLFRSENYTNIEPPSTNQILGYDIPYFINEDNLIRYSLPVNGDGKIFMITYEIPVELYIEERDEGRFLLYLLPLTLSILITILNQIYNHLNIRKQIVKPIARLNECIGEFSRGNLGSKVVQEGSGELLALAANLEWMRDELQYAQAEQRKSEKARKELIACISHDLRTPVASIQAYAKGLLDGVAQNEEMMRRYVAVINQKTESLSKLIEDLFQHAQAELGEFRYHFVECYSDELFEKILQTAIMEFHESGYLLEAPTEIPRTLLKADPVRIEQVVMNLLQNAKKYSEPGTRIGIVIHDEGEMMSFSVRDNGPGIEAADIPYIFEHFYRAEKSRSKDFGGSGLGLAICKDIMKAHQGEIFVSSKTQQGSTFTCILPKVSH